MKGIGLTGRWEHELAVFVDWRLLVDLEPGLAGTSLSGVGSGLCLGQHDIDVLLQLW